MVRYLENGCSNRRNNEILDPRVSLDTSQFLEIVSPLMEILQIGSPSGKFMFL